MGILEYCGMYTATIFIGLVIVQNIQKVKESEIPTRSLATSLITVGLIVIIGLIPLAVVLLMIMALYRRTVHLFLKIRYGRSYVGLVTGSDAVHTVDNPSNSKTCLLVILEHDCASSSHTLFDVVKDHFINSIKYIEKLSSTYHNFMGYTYMVQTTMDASECIKEMVPVNPKVEEIDDEELIGMLTSAYNRDFPRNNTIFWDILISTHPIKWKKIDCKDKKYYPVIFRIHHCVADGVAVFKLFVGVLGSKVALLNEPRGEVNVKKWRRKNSSLTNFLNILGKFLERLLELFRVILFAPSSAFINLFVRGNDQNFLHRGNLSGESRLIFRVEQQHIYFQKIKAIKRRVLGTSFPEIVLTGLSASLSEYYYMKSTDRPKYITVGIPVVPGSAELQNLTPGSLRVPNLEFSNNYALILLNLPLCVETSAKTPLTSRLKLIKDQTNIVSNSVDYQVIYIFMRAVLSILPRPFIRLFLKMLNCTAAVSIMPGSCKLKFGRDTAICNECGFWIPHLRNIGVGISVLTYDERLFIGLSVDKNVPITVDEGRSIVDNAFRYIDLLEKEVNCDK
ncbi:hypothetical protein RI129_008625 [Pyrocoelia pectoralis]|uniref:O-acyltransferase WSD1 C-terminal domain-containing protein n=1 Tax=Pyrocoelia pectoralis TaxID=417401 RepID=A0AAN7ZKB2_9COLE